MRNYLIPKAVLPAAAALLLPCLAALRADEVAPDPKVDFALSRATAKPGETADLILSVKSSAPILSMSISLDFDESKVRVLEATRILPEGQVGSLDPPPPDDLSSVTVSNVDIQFGNQVSEGWIHLETKTTPEGAPRVDSSEFVAVLAIRFLVLPGAPPGFTPVSFDTIGPVDDLGSSYFINRVVFEGGKGAVDPATMEGGGIDIIGEVGFFMRGDTSFDLKRDITDPIMTISYLFLGGMNLPCADAADANDDGELDVSDAVFTFRMLFQESGHFPEPSEWGKDPTQDSLGCPISRG